MARDVVSSSNPCAEYRIFAMEPSLQRKELRGTRRADPRARVLHGPPRHGELAEVVTDHLRLDVHRHERLPVVDGDLLSHEPREDRQVPRVRLHRLVRPIRLDLLEEGRALVVDPAKERAPGTGRQKGDDLLHRHRLQFVEREPAVGEFLLPADLHARRLLPQPPPGRLRRSTLFLRHAYFLRFRLGESRPTLRPGGAPADTVLGRPTCWWAPPPWGWSTGFFATPRTTIADFALLR